MVHKETITGRMEHDMKTNYYWAYVARNVNKLITGRM